jgi:peptidoglycan hydrolase-like protein with peptidoglycan-binding domain
MAIALAVGGAVAFVAPGAAHAALPTCTVTKMRSGAFVPATAGGSFNCKLRRGNSSDAVATLQNTMDICYGENLATDGVFGRATEEALKRVQRAEGTGADGIYGPNTRRAMKHQLEQGGGVRCGNVS